MQNQKTIEFQGKVIKRIFNPEQVSAKGSKYSINYLILEWTTGASQEYTDLIAIKTLSAKEILDVRAGYKIIVRARYACKTFDDELKYNTYTKDNVTIKKPMLFPEFILIKDGVTIVDVSENLEEHTDANTLFQQQVIDPEPEDDLPF